MGEVIDLGASVEQRGEVGGQVASAVAPTSILGPSCPENGACVIDCCEHKGKTF